jgi:hypothetical protein
LKEIEANLLENMLHLRSLNLSGGSLVATMEEERHGLEKTGNCLEKIGSGGLRIVPKINLALIPC